MRMTKAFIFAVAVTLAGTQAGAQNTTDAGNAADVAAENAASTTTNDVSAPSAVPAADANALEPIDSNTGEIDSTDMGTPPPVDEGGRSFPWGLLGLLGLLGLIPRLRGGR